MNKRYQKRCSETVNQSRTDNTMKKRYQKRLSEAVNQRRTDNTMNKRQQKKCSEFFFRNLQRSIGNSFHEIAFITQYIVGIISEIDENSAYSWEVCDKCGRDRLAEKPNTKYELFLVIHMYFKLIQY